MEKVQEEPCHAHRLDYFFSSEQHCSIMKELSLEKSCVSNGRIGSEAHQSRFGERVLRTRVDDTDC